ncbi:MAG: hypothetical protein ABR615_10760 [Pseudonocardiaceae bacterium]
MSSSDVSHQLRQAGLRVTAPRQSVRQWLADHPHATAEQVRGGVAQRLGSVSTRRCTTSWPLAPAPGWCRIDENHYQEALQ